MPSDFELALYIISSVAGAIYGFFIKSPKEGVIMRLFGSILFALFFPFITFILITIVSTWYWFIETYIFKGLSPIWLKLFSVFLVVSTTYGAYEGYFDYEEKTVLLNIKHSILKALFYFVAASFAISLMVTFIYFVDDKINSVIWKNIFIGILVVTSFLGAIVGLAIDAEDKSVSKVTRLLRAIIFAYIMPFIFFSTCLTIYAAACILLNILFMFLPPDEGL